jgi:hypothetical protein
MASIINASTSGVGGVITTADNSGILNIQTAGTTAITVNASQNVGLGVTPSAWGGSWKAVDVSGGGAFAGAFNSAYMLGNAYYNASNGVYKATGPAGHYGIEAGTHVWKTAPSGTAGNTITFTQAMTLDASGNLLVGLTSATGIFANSKLAVAQTTTGYWSATFGNTTSGAGDGGIQIYSGDGSTGPWLINAGTTAGITKFRVLGNGNALNTNNSYGALSDAKLKENIADASPKLEDLCKVKIRNYNLKSDPDYKQIGVIAQELETVFPSLVEEGLDRDENGALLETSTKSVKYSVFVPILIKAIQEQQAMIQELKAEIDLLKGVK